jgi:hypothetical protein
MRSARPFSIDRFAIGCAGAAVATAPLWLALAPGIALWAARQRRGRRPRGLRVLWPRFATTVERYAAAMIPVASPEVPWSVVASRVDAYLASHRSPRGWRLPVLLAVLEFAPVFAGCLPASWASRRRLAAFCRRRLSTSTGIWGRLSLIRQLIRMGYYGDPRAHERMGYRPRVEIAAEARDDGRVRPAPGAVAVPRTPQVVEAFAS